MLNLLNGLNGVHNAIAPHECFWCGKPLPLKEDRTRDHLFYRHMRPSTPNAYRYMSVRSCKDCNGLRAQISSLHNMMRRAKNRAELKGTGFKPQKFVDMAVRIMPIIELFQQKINDLLVGEVRELCLREINEVMAVFELDEKEVRV